ncbi:MAG TPA: phospholipase D-like domain-containing protein, partial [Myxococcota bacterium]|nr:phospholipase D-like domain-containing protein [Myxococcota bacterium]
MLRRLFRCALGLALVAGCGGEAPDEDGLDDDIAVPGKADDAWGACQVRQVLAWVNEPTTSAAVLKTIGLTSRPCKNIVSHRDGQDRLPTTADDDLFDTIEELDAVPYVGPKAMQRLVEAVAERCQARPEPELVFSPQAYEASHLAKLATWIQGAQRSIDVAMYSFSDTNTLNALDAAVRRGVKVRFVFETASEDRKAPAGTWSAKLEDRGVDVRYVNKIMHHKFAIIDGPRDAVEQAYSGRLVTGSGNWSNSAATRYDENTAFIQGDGELLLRFQKEFNLLWENSRDFAWNLSLLQERGLPIADALIPDDPGVDAVYTSANFRTTTTAAGPGFTLVTGSDTVADRLVALIQGAQSSIHVASGHLRSRPVALALMARHAERPDMDIRVYLDNQEFISEWYDSQQQAELATCLQAAGTSEAKQRACYDKGYYYSFPVQAA